MNNKLKNDFFHNLRDRIDWNYLHKFKNEETSISLLVELNANISYLTQIMLELLNRLQGGESNIVNCPNCKTDVVPNGLGYCPNCNCDLFRYVKSEEYHLGKKVD